MDNETGQTAFLACIAWILLNIVWELRKIRKLHEGGEDDRADEGDRTIRYPLK